MKKILGYTILFLFLSTGARAQEFDLGDIMGEAQDFFGEAQEKAEHQADTEAQKKFEAAFKDKFKKWGEFSSNLDNYTAYSKCFYLIAKYVMEMDGLREETEKSKDCKKKYDLYGMQLMAMMSSTSIMYCTEELYNKIADVFGTLKVGERRDPNAFDELDEFVREMNTLVLILHTVDLLGDNYTETERNANDIFDEYMKDHEITDFEETILRFLSQHYDDLIMVKDGIALFDITKVADLINQYFHPLSLMKDGVDISQKMDRLKPCAGL
ncbi:hypothetical protein LDL77_10305 [Flagellimonas marinaquae]|uniref:hypothetical protein n=1 Tax=Flagellimonas aurea TaxID=2915619 RepID=UPI001CE0BBF7|nr:hypothetical protein LDL77_10305 [Allomuricauda aquimarina]